MIRAFCPSDLDWLVERHQHYTAEEGFDHSFGVLVRSILNDFVADHDPSCEAGWIVEDEGARLGSIFCVRHDADTARLRLFLLVPEARGKGHGRALLGHCMAFARSRGYRGMTLSTHESHKAACALYARTGWTLERSFPVTSFGRRLVEQDWSFRFAKPVLRTTVR